MKGVISDAFQPGLPRAKHRENWNLISPMSSGMAFLMGRHRKSALLVELLLFASEPWKLKQVASEIQETKATQM